MLYDFKNEFDSSHIGLHNISNTRNLQVDLATADCLVLTSNSIALFFKNCEYLIQN